MTNIEIAQAISELRTDLQQSQKGLQDQISEIKTSLDELTGAKKALLWLTGTVLGIVGIIGAFLDANRHK